MVKMKFLDLNTDVLAIKCFKNYVFIGIGCTLYAVDKVHFKIKIKIDALHPDNIHNITIKSNNKLIVYGGKSLCMFSLDIKDDDSLSLQKLGEIHRFKDWIITIKWQEPLDHSKLTILFAHNYVYSYHIDQKYFYKTTCKETCLLYAGTLSSQDNDNVVIFSGTVFQEILIWKADTNLDGMYAEVLHRLKGHKGVIFSVFYNVSHNLICSTSDDRTVRLWKISNNSIDDQNSLNWANVSISLQTTMYGHLARVWKAIMLKNTIASIGEDSRMCLWNLSGDLLHKIEAHQGAPIWCIDMSDDDIVFTGGADGSVNSWPFTSIKNYIINNIILEDNKALIPKHVTFGSNSDILIYTNSDEKRKILHFSNSNYRLINSYGLPEYTSTYCIMELSPDKQYIALASIKGDITLYKKIKNIWVDFASYKIIDEKIFSLQWLSNETILICAAEGILYIIKFLTKGIEVLSQYILPPSRERWITAACTYRNFLICGDRMGSIFIYQLQSNSRDPLQTFKKIHGRLGVQSCTIMNSSLITTGRDGTLKFYKFCNTNSSSNSIVEFLYAKNMPMDWVSKLLRIQNDYYVLGFKEDDFVIYSVSLKRILVKISCGGGHRSWDCLIHDKFIYFVYIQKRQVHAVTVPTETLFIPPLLVGFHTKEIYSIKVLPTLSTNYNILISGGEDGILHINYINNVSTEREPNLTSVDSFDGHLSSIKCTAIMPLTAYENVKKYLIFSGGGRAQLKIWEISIKMSMNSFSKDDLSCKDLLSYMLHGPDEERNKIWVGKELMYNADPETRYMDLSLIMHPENINCILIFIACSDGYLRTLSYNISLNQIKLVDTLAYKNRCILKVHSFTHEERILLITMATDGLLNFWNVSIQNEIVSVQNIPIDEKEDFSLHQSGINSYDIQILNDHQYILGTGGDDNLLNLLIFEILNIENKIKIQTKSQWTTASIHYAQITGIKILEGNRLFSVGADQKLAIHKFEYDNSNITSTLVDEKSLCISDIQGITFLDRQKSNAEHFCVYGKGFQLLQNEL